MIFTKMPHPHLAPGKARVENLSASLGARSSPRAHKN